MLFASAMGKLSCSREISADICDVPDMSIDGVILDAGSRVHAGLRGRCEVLHRAQEEDAIIGC